MKKKITLLTVLATLIFTGCQGQDGGMQAHLIKWDNNGLKVGSIETNGSQAAIGKNVDEANTRFNDTIRDKNIQNHREDMAAKHSSLTKELARQGRPTSDIKTLTKKLLTRKQ